ncbi:carboxypeptidase-like regulatory domain-containing protein [Flagellimonas amoyensis]|uniref:carboxypeptidase-like regulatory domain-containing protein n=1 Tax=Flagellimonas amoyensis TaxID=2169401 RepID=UPI000D3B107E|nr:carboxypeptidase-like regulatory domain-containing protein [Allomuricauda amoyensis]
MKHILLVFFSLLISAVSLAQDGGQLLRGKVLYRSTNVPNENVINSTSGEATITNNDGEFAIVVKEGDELVFTAVNYQLMVVKISPEILANNRLVVEVNEKVTELDEVIVTPENQEGFLRVKNEDFKQFDYEIDRGTEVVNVAESQAVRGMQNGLNIKNIFKALFKSREVDGQEREPLKVSEVLRHVYDDEFFVLDLKLPQDKIDAFLIYCDDKIPSQTLLRKDNEFQLIDFLVTQSKEYLETLNEE